MQGAAVCKRDLCDDRCFIEVFVDCPVEVCQQRDPKGMYRKAREGVIKEFTGISAPYEPPENPETHLHTDKLAVDECVNLILRYLAGRGFVELQRDAAQRAYERLTGPPFGSHGVSGKTRPSLRTGLFRNRR